MPNPLPRDQLPEVPRRPAHSIAACQTADGEWWCLTCVRDVFQPPDVSVLREMAAWLEKANNLTPPPPASDDLTRLRRFARATCDALGAYCSSPMPTNDTELIQQLRNLKESVRLAIEQFTQDAPEQPASEAERVYPGVPIASVPWFPEGYPECGSITLGAPASDELTRLRRIVSKVKRELYKYDTTCSFVNQGNVAVSTVENIRRALGDAYDPSEQPASEAHDVNELGVVAHMLELERAKCRELQQLAAIGQAAVEAQLAHERYAQASDENNACNVEEESRFDAYSAAARKRTGLIAAYNEQRKGRADG